MKIQNISDVNTFFKVIDSCKGTVELVSPEGDRINLKSKLSQYLSMANIFSNGYIKELDLVAQTDAAHRVLAVTSEHERIHHVDAVGQQILQRQRQR